MNIYEKDIPYYGITFSDKKTIKGILKFREYIERDAYKGSKEALCILVDFDTIVNSLDLNKNDKKIIQYMQSGFDNYNYDGQYLSDAKIIAKEMNLDEALVLKRINRIVNMIYEKNFYIWQNTYCKKFKDWILKSKTERNSILKQCTEKRKHDFDQKTAFVFTNNPITSGFKYDKLLELEEIQKKLEAKIKNCEDKRERTKIISFLISLSQDVNDIRKSLNITVNEKSQDFQTNNIEFVNEMELSRERSDVPFFDVFTAWRIQNIIQKYMTKRQQIIFNHYFVKKEKQIIIAEKLKCSQQSISDELKNIIKELQFLIKNT